MCNTACCSFSNWIRQQQTKRRWLMKLMEMIQLEAACVINGLWSSKKGEFDLEDKPHSSRPQEFRSNDLQALSNYDSTQSTLELVGKLYVIHSTIAKCFPNMRKIQKYDKVFHVNCQREELNSILPFVFHFLPEMKKTLFFVGDCY